ncbi:methanol O-anthraniloyltransferase-like [Diospyros lotus]|uniref:methanol O-anthraniloyltransferase-like n=1 Tax=Diospyros lotus TaxID=55363 RepID=UPI0022507BB5|nr:methanol O-anthraniloyltransferase-like [Diospyros lotus]
MRAYNYHRFLIGELCSDNPNPRTQTLMAPPSSSPFYVRIRNLELLPPAKPTPRVLKQLSDIDDQKALRFQLPVVMLYENKRNAPGTGRRDPVRVIREAIAEALVFYYPLAGRLIEGPNKKLAMDCTGEGVLFLEADADVSLEQLGDAIQPPCPYMNEFLYDVPGSGGITDCPLMLFQITRLSCGGFVFAIRLNHVISDGPGLVQFLKAVAEIAQGSSEPSLLPVWERELLNARHPPKITCAHHAYENLSNHNSRLVSMASNNTVHESFFFGHTEIRALLRHLPPRLQSSSTFDVLTASLWRCWAISMVPNPEEIVSLCFSTTVRGKNGVRLPRGYYGNAFVMASAISEAGKLCRNPVGYALELVKKAKAQVNEEFIRSSADCIVMKERPSFLTPWNFVVNDTTRAGFTEVDFGWGMPTYGGPEHTDTSLMNLCTRFKNGKAEKVIMVPMHLPVAAMERFEEEIWTMTREPVEHSILVESANQIPSRL